MKHITRTVWILSIISFFTDISSEMLYPVLPLFLESVGYSVVFIGVLEGIAEATAGLSKGYFGKLSDSMGKRLPFVRLGYAFSAVAKPMLAIILNPLWIFFARMLDRFGKGIRTGARDAMLSDEGTAETKGRVFGFHRAMDTMGAAVGPTLALIYLAFFPGEYLTLFYLAFIPGLLTVLITFFLREKEVKKEREKNTGFRFKDLIPYWKESPVKYRRLVIGLLLFTLFNSSDVFLLLKLKNAGESDTVIIGMYIFYNLIYALFAMPMGYLADRFGLKSIYIAGIFFFAIVYFGMAFGNGMNVYIFLFFIYGLFAAATEGVSKAWISNCVDSSETASAIGSYSAFQSVLTMLASSIAGLIWFYYGSTATFFITGIASVGVIFYFIFIKIEMKNQVME